MIKPPSSSEQSSETEDETTDETDAQEEEVLSVLLIPHLAWTGLLPTPKTAKLPIREISQSVWMPGIRILGGYERTGTNGSWIFPDEKQSYDRNQRKFFQNSRI